MSGRRMPVGRRAAGRPRGSRATLLSAAAVRRVLRAVLEGERRRADVQVTFLGPARMRRLNSEWKGHDRPTDVLSFALPQPDGSLAAEVFICGQVACRQARDLGVPPREELVRLVVHGTLHALGHDHPEGAGRTRSAMWRRQERYVRALT